MNIILVLLIKIIPLYLLMVVGFVSGRLLDLSRLTIARLLIYVAAPVVVFNAVASAELNFRILMLPIILFLLCSAISLFAFILTKKQFSDSIKHIFAFMSGAGNVGYFGLPLVLSMLDKSHEGVAVLMILGVILFENTLGFFIVANGNHSKRQSLYKVLKLPALWAFLMGLIFNFFGFKFTQPVVDFINNFRGVYIVLGAMLIGVSLSKFNFLKKESFDISLIIKTFIARFFFWPLIVILLINFDFIFFKFYSESVYKVLFLMSLVPPATNSVALAVELDVYPEKTAVVLLSGIIFVLFFIPTIIYFSNYLLPFNFIIWK